MKEASKATSKRGGTSCAASMIKDKGLIIQKKVQPSERDKQFSDFKNQTQEPNGSNSLNQYTRENNQLSSLQGIASNRRQKLNKKMNINQTALIMNQFDEQDSVQAAHYEKNSRLFQIKKKAGLYNKSPDRLQSIRQEID